MPSWIKAQTYYVSTTGSDVTGDGSNTNPWATITFALDQVLDGSTILVKCGIYNGRVRMRGSFNTGVTVKSEIPYLAIMRNNDRVFTFYKDARGCRGITLSGFDIAHSGVGSAGLVVHIDGGSDNSVSDIIIENNIIHDSYNNDLLKINNACTQIGVYGNMFYNQSGSDEHIDVNSVEDVTIENNVFFNDFAGSGRANGNNTSSYIVIKDSNGSSDIFSGSKDVTVAKNVFLNWEGSTGSNFVLCGEDGQSFFEAQDVMIENNLMLGNAANVMRAAFGVKGCKNITFRNNSISGNLPSLAFAFRFNLEGNNLVNENIYCYNNIWSDPDGTMDDFSDTPIGETTAWVLENNLYWNGGNAIPEQAAELINYSDDPSRIEAEPLLGSLSGIVLPRWIPVSEQFADGSDAIAQVFLNLIQNYGTISSGSPARNIASVAHAPTHDILGNPRYQPDIGAFEIVGPTCSSHPENQWVGSDGDWYENTSNWSLGRWPESCDSVILGTHEVTVSAGDTARAYFLEIPISGQFLVHPQAIIMVGSP